MKLHPHFHYTGTRLPEGGSAKLFVISRPALAKDEFYPDGMCYLTPDLERWGPLDLAAAWHEHERILADEMAAQVILSNPRLFFGNVVVEEVL